MRRAILLSLSVALLAVVAPAQGVTPIYVSFHSHNEDAGYWSGLVTNRRNYLTYRSDLIERVNLIASRGATFNWQSDHPVLRAMAAYERGPLLRSTGNKNVLRWMVEDKGVEVDPHGHLAMYNYADLAYLIQALGVTPSGTIAGVTIYECGDLPGTIEWLDWASVVGLQGDGTIHGNVYPDAVWAPDLLHGGAMAGHGYDDSTSGAWNCGTGSDFHVHQPSGNVTVIGTGYGADEMLVGSDAHYGSGGYLSELAAKIASGELPADQIYTASVIVRDAPSTREVPDTNQALEDFLDAIQPLVDSGQIVYATLSQVRDIWQTTYASTPNQVGPEQFSAYDEVVLEVCRDGDFACGTDTCTTGEVCDPGAAICRNDCRLSYNGCTSSLTCNRMNGLCE
jgi:hypothetical protein